MSTPQPPEDQGGPGSLQKQPGLPPVPSPSSSLPPYPTAPAGGPWGHAPPWPPSAPGKRRFSVPAVLALVTALLGLFPAALALGIVALQRVADRRERGKGFALAGIALAGMQIAALAALVPVMVREDAQGSGTEAAADREPYQEPDGERERGSGGGGPEDGAGEGEPGGPGAVGGREEVPREGGEEIDVFTIDVGDCFDAGGLGGYDGEGSEAYAVTRLSCEERHEAEAYGSARVEGYGGFPGDEELARLAEDECDALIQPYVLDPWLLPADVGIYYYYPQEAGWLFGDREILCFFGSTGGEPLRGALRGDKDGMTAEQLQYLRITAPLDLTVWEEPSQDGRPGELRDWAGEMAEVLDREAAALAEAGWSSGIEGTVTELVTARETSSGHWRQAADAGGDAFWDHYTTAYDTMGYGHEITIRERLGLDTSDG